MSSKMIKLNIRVSARRSQLQLFNADRYNHSSQSIVTQLQNFLRSINRMCNVILVPNRLSAIDSTTVTDDTSALGQDLQHLYQLLTEADHQLRWGSEISEQLHGTTPARRPDTKNSAESSAVVSDLEINDADDDTGDEDSGGDDSSTEDNDEDVNVTTEKMNQVDLEEQQVDGQEEDKSRPKKVGNQESGPVDSSNKQGKESLNENLTKNCSNLMRPDNHHHSRRHHSRRHSSFSTSSQWHNSKKKKKNVKLDENSNPIHHSDGNQTESEDDSRTDIRCRKCRSKRQPMMSVNCSRCAELLLKSRKRMLSKGLSLIKKINHRRSKAVATLSIQQSATSSTSSTSGNKQAVATIHSKQQQQRLEEQDRHMQERLKFHLRQLVAILNELSETAEQLERRYLQAIQE